jgi:uncharacterized protein (TIGR02246 family)
LAQSPAPNPSRAGSPEDEKAIRAVIDSFIQSFAKADAKAIAGLFTEQGEAISAEGVAIRGRSALEAHYAERFQASPGEKLEVTPEPIHFLAPEAARVDGRARLIVVGPEPPSSSRFSATFLKTGAGGRWLLASLRELDDPEISHHERLRELEWLVGEWVEETGDAVVSTSVAWSDDENFLIRSFDIKAQGKPEMKGTQRIGWDPLAKQFKSWVFDSKGGFSEGHWTHDNDGDRWVIKSTGVRPDGQTTTATQTLTRLKKDHVLWTSTDRTLGAEATGEVVEFVMVRKPPEPK